MKASALSSIATPRNLLERVPLAASRRARRHGEGAAQSARQIHLTANGTESYRAVPGRRIGGEATGMPALFELIESRFRPTDRAFLAVPPVFPARPTKV